MLAARAVQYAAMSTLFSAVLAQIRIPPDSVDINYYYSVPENTAKNTVIFNFTAKYKTPGHHVVTVEVESDTAKFVSLQKVEGSDSVWNVILKSDLDRETRDQIPLTFTAHGDMDLTLSTQLIVTDLNDNKPQFLNLPYTADVKENTSRGVTVYTNVNATDPDQGPGGVVTFVMKPVSLGAQYVFVMNTTTGEVELNGSLDFEKTNFYHYTVTALDGGSQPLSSSTDFFITVQDVQDTPPFFTGLPYTASINEGANAQTSVMTVTAQDGDRGPGVSNRLSYNISGGPCVFLFEIDQNTGILSVKNSSLDRDTAPLSGTNGVCNITVQATEVDSNLNPFPGNTTAGEFVIVTVNDLNDNTPTFSNSSYTATIKENSPAGVPLVWKSGAQITVSDKDQGSNSYMTISLETQHDVFELEQTHIQSEGSVFIRVKDQTLLDYEQTRQYLINVVAADGPDDGSGNSATATVTVNIEPVNEFTPEFNNTDIKASVPEGSHPGTSVFNVSAFDRDSGGTDGVFTFSLHNDQGMFSINAITGEVTVASSEIDREKDASYLLLVQVEDKGGLVNTTSLTVTVDDVNDWPPSFLRSEYETSLAENEKHFSKPLILEATDQDQEMSPNSNITFSMSPCQCGNYFNIDGISGNLTVTKPLDYENISSTSGRRGIIILTALATDQGNPQLTANVSVIINLLDVNDNSPAFTNQTYSARVFENATTGFSVLQVQARDDDGSAPNNEVRYFIEAGAQDRFRINPSTGAITVSGPLDREEVDSYTLTVLARDQAAESRAAQATVYINITDVNDEPPSFGERREVTIDVNETRSGPLYNMTASDPDLNSQLRYQILWNESSWLTGAPQQVSEKTVKDLIAIDETSGTIKASQPLNKTVVRKLSLSILVKDSKAGNNTSQSAKGVLTINIMDINNNAPRFTPSGSVSASIRENSAVGTALLFTSPVHVADFDEGTNSEFELKLDGTFATYFAVYPVNVQSSADVIIQVKNNSILDFEERDNLLLNVTAKETQTAEKLYEILVVRLNITDENDHGPVFKNTSYEVTIPEDKAKGSSVFTVQATDGDKSKEYNRVTYLLPDTNELFHIDNTTGVVSVAQDGLDYEKRKSYSLTVEASDDGGRRSTVTLTVHLTDVNDNPPVFARPEYFAFVTEGKDSFDLPVTVTANDADDGLNKKIQYFILNISATSHSFTVNATTGELGLVAPLDYESLPKNPTGAVVVVVGARDHGVPAAEVTVNVTITVKDVNDNSPEFENSTYHVVVPEDVNISTAILRVRAPDADGSAPNNKVFYSIEDGDHDRFQVGHASGVVTVVGQLDRETEAQYTLKIMASDEGEPPAQNYSTVHIDISDVNDYLPQFRDKNVQMSVSGGLFGLIYNMSAVDLDLNSQLYYSILWNQSYGRSALQEVVPGEKLTNWLHIDSELGTIQALRPFNSLQIRRFVLTLMVEDLNASYPRPQTDTAIFSVEVLGHNISRRAVGENHVKNTAHVSKQGGKEWDTAVSFSAGLTENVEVTDAQRVVYDRVFVNDGSGYSNSTGTFTCPLSGLYTFEVRTLAPSNSDVQLRLCHNGHNVMTIEARAREGPAAEGNFAVVQLTQGDAVYVTSVPGDKSRLYGAPDAILNTFSGYLISQDS